MDPPDESRPDGWRQHRDDQTRSWLRLTAEQRLEWLEGAKQFAADALGAAHRRSSGKAEVSRGHSR